MPDVVRRQEGEPAGEAPTTAAWEQQRHRDRAARSRCSPTSTSTEQTARFGRYGWSTATSSAGALGRRRTQRAATSCRHGSDLPVLRPLLRRRPRRANGTRAPTRRTSARSPPPASSTGTRAPFRSTSLANPNVDLWGHISVLVEYSEEVRHRRRPPRRPARTRTLTYPHPNPIGSDADHGGHHRDAPVERARRRRGVDRQHRLRGARDVEPAAAARDVLCFYLLGSELGRLRSKGGARTPPTLA